jgi:predicted acyltransferase
MEPAVPVSKPQIDLPPVEPVPETRSERLVSLDAFRGLIIALMILVNTAGGFPGTYQPLTHSDWNGWTITDVVFPSFLWIVGVSLTLSLSKHMKAGAPRRQLALRVLRRGAILYLLGLLIYAFPKFDLTTMRILGVLQRIAICYVAASLLYLWTGVRTQIACIVVLLAGYWALMMFVPVPGYGTGRLDVEGNLAHYVDSIVLGHHNYASTKTWDPEGIVSTLPAIATALFGIMAAYLLRLRRPLAERTTWLFLTGGVLIALGMMCDMWLPINKKLWTSSFALFMAGLDFMLFAGFLWLIDGQGFKRFAKPFVILGMNAITIYMIAELLETTLNVIRWNSGTHVISVRQWIFQSFYAPLFTPADASLLFSLTYVLLMFVIAYGMYRRGWFLRV